MRWRDLWILILTANMIEFSIQLKNWQHSREIGDSKSLFHDNSIDNCRKYVQLLHWSIFIINQPYCYFCSLFSWSLIFIAKSLTVRTVCTHELLWSHSSHFQIPFTSIFITLTFPLTRQRQVILEWDPLHFIDAWIQSDLWLQVTGLPCPLVIS